jgi:hypothetical protein
MVPARPRPSAPQRKSPGQRPQRYGSGWIGDVRGERTLSCRKPPSPAAPVAENQPAAATLIGLHAHPHFAEPDGMTHAARLRPARPIRRAAHNVAAQSPGSLGVDRIRTRRHAVDILAGIVPSAPATCGGPRPASVPRRTPQPDGRSPASWRSRHSPLYVAPWSAWRRFTRPRSTRQTLWIVAAGGRPVPVQRRSTESADRRYPHGRPSACGQSAPAEPRVGLASTSGQTAIATAADVTDRKDSVHISTRDRASVD